jgi:mono/diheme cytochrome c family protein
MRVSSIAIAAATALTVTSTAAAADLELGKKVFGEKCASCHAPDGKGNEKMSQMLKTKIGDLSTSTKSDADMLQLVTDGKKPMPAFGKALSKEEMDAVVQYAKRLRAGAK